MIYTYYILHPQTQMTATLCQPLLCRQVTYRALEQLSESGFDLVKVEAAVKRTRHSQNLDSLLVAASPRPPSSCPIDTVTRDLASKGESDTALCKKQPSTIKYIICRCENETGRYSFSEGDSKGPRETFVQI